ncbi:hypothetical protein D3C84_894350 [compost metagenome]
MPAFVPEMLTPLDLHDVRGFQIAHAFDVSQREGVSLSADFHHQAAHHRQGQRYFEMETAALARRLLQFHCAAQLADHVLHRVQPDAAPGDFRNGVAQAEARQEQERQQLLFT